MTMPKRSGLDLLKDIKAIDPHKPVIMVTAYGTIETAVEAMKHGAFDYIVKPFNFETFTFVVERALEYQPTPSTQDSEKLTEGETKWEIVTQNENMMKLLKVSKNVARSKATIMIQSESGTGKELLARYIHQHSERGNRSFVPINCAALPDTLLESELFGYKKGAFTGASQDHRGKFEQANGGTILLDEISEMALPLQAKLLRVLQEQEVDKVGGKEPIPIDVRVVATTNRNILKLVEEEKFREDLYFRLNVIPLSLPPLRERKDDIPFLADHFLAKHARLNNRSRPQITRETLNVLMNYNWRGNVRELENIIERALLLADGANLESSDLLIHSSENFQVFNEEPFCPVTLSEDEPGSESMKIEVGMSMREAEKKLIFETLKTTSGNRTHAAKILGISIRTLRNKLNEYRMEGEAFEFHA